MGAVAIWRAFNLSDVVLGLGGAVMVAVGMPYAFRARLIAKFFGRTGEVGYDGPVLRLVGSIYLVFGCVLLAAAGMFVHL